MVIVNVHGQSVHIAQTLFAPIGRVPNPAPTTRLVSLRIFKKILQPARKLAGIKILKFFQQFLLLFR